MDFSGSAGSSSCTTSGLGGTVAPHEWLTWRARVRKEVLSSGTWLLQTICSVLPRSLWFCLPAVLVIRLANLVDEQALSSQVRSWLLQPCAMAVTVAVLVVWIPVPEERSPCSQTLGLNWRVSCCQIGRAWSQRSGNGQIKQENMSRAVGGSTVYALGCNEAASPGAINFSTVVLSMTQRQWLLYVAWVNCLAPTLPGKATSERVAGPAAQACHLPNQGSVLQAAAGIKSLAWRYAAMPWVCELDRSLSQAKWRSMLGWASMKLLPTDAFRKAARSMLGIHSASCESLLWVLAPSGKPSASHVVEQGVQDKIRPFCLVWQKLPSLQLTERRRSCVWVSFVTKLAVTKNRESNPTKKEMSWAKSTHIIKTYKYVICDTSGISMAEIGISPIFQQQNNEDSKKDKATKHWQIHHHLDLGEVIRYL